MDIKTPSLSEPNIKQPIKENKENKGNKKRKKQLEKKVKYLDQLYSKEFINKYFNEK